HIERSEYPAGYQFTIHKHAKFGTVLVAALSAHVFHKAPMRLDAERQPDRRVLAIEQTESRVERDRLQRRLTAIVKSAHAREFVIGARRYGRETEPVRETVFGLDRRRDRIVGAVELAEAAGRIGLKLLFSRLPDIAAFREAEHMLGVDLARLVRMLTVL